MHHCTRVRTGLSVCLLAAALCAGCDALLDFLQPRLVTVRLVNNGSFPVEVLLLYSSEQDIPEELLSEVGDEVQVTIPAGETTTFSRSCDDLQAIIIEDADLMVIGQIGPEAGTGVLRDGDEFGCGDTIIFTFDHSDILVDFDVSTDVEGN